MATIATRFKLIDDVSSPLNNIQHNIEHTNQGFSSMTDKLVAVNSALSILNQGVEIVKKVAGAVSGFISDASEYENLMASLTVATGNAIEAQEEFAKLQDFAAHTPFDMPGVVQASVMFRNAGVEAEKLIPTIQMLGDLSQGNNEYFNRMALNFMQIKSAGKATMMDLNQFAYMGVPIKQTLQSMGVEGQATAEQVEEAMRRMTSAGGQFYNSMGANAGTLAGMNSNLADSFQKVSATIGNAFLPIIKAINPAIQEILDKLASTSIFSNLMVTIQNTCDFILQNLDSIIATMINMGSIAISVGTIMATAWMIAHWPITLIIIGIITVSRLIFDLTAQSNDMSMQMTGSFNQVSQALSVMGGIIGGIGSLIGGLMNIIYNVVGTLFNALMTVSEFVMNIFTHPVQAIKGLFVNLGMVILNVLSSVAGVIDLVFNTNLSNSLNNVTKKLQDWKDENVGGFKYNRVEMKNVNGVMEGIKNGARMGEEFGSVVDKALTNILPKEYTTDPFAGEHIPQKYLDYMNNVPQIPELPLDGNGNMKVAVENEIKINDEYKQLLAEKAVEEYKIKYSSTTPSINFGDINVAETVDANQVLDIVATGLSELVSSDLSV